MKALVILFGLVALGAALSKDYFGWVHPTYYDDKKLKVLYTCLIGKEKCSNFEIHINDRFSGIIETDCDKCTMNEKEIVAYVIDRIAQVSSSDLYELLKVKDPTGKHSKHFLKFVQSFSEERGYPKLSDDVINGLPDSS